MKIEKVKVAKGTTIKEIEKSQVTDYIANGWRLIEETPIYEGNPFKK